MDYQFTVLVAIYNVEEYIRAFLESLEHQSYPSVKFEIVAVDDGSLDESAEIFKAWARGRPNVKFVSQSNAGPGAARATALALATGQWITVADPDDILDKDYFSAVSKFIQRDAEQRSSILSHVYIYLMTALETFGISTRSVKSSDSAIEWLRCPMNQKRFSLVRQHSLGLLSLENMI